MKALASLALAAAVILTAAPVGPATAAPAPPGAGRSCFWVRDVNNFAAADDQHLYVRVGVSQVFELDLFSHCLDVDWVQHLGLHTRASSNVCEGPNPDLDVITHSVGIGHQRCPVTRITRLTPEQIAALPKQARP